MKAMGSGGGDLFFPHWRDELRKVTKLNQKVPWQLGREEHIRGRDAKGVSY